MFEPRICFPQKLHLFYWIDSEHHCGKKVGKNVAGTTKPNWHSSFVFPEFQWEQDQWGGSSDGGMVNQIFGFTFLRIAIE